eukprot:TRINITY_DN10998_c0_g1_i2.p1 TRINITY_DN10998_c0_g1~~TRINITY_DN10998_c0_g1_i2.p1  ORF type:complete len:356 (-),score=64.47 TRINITY_DN10998_c0_g1_i2:252-1319(-)
MTSTMQYGSSHPGLAAASSTGDFAMFSSMQVAEWGRSINLSPSTIQYIQNNNVTGRDILAANEEQMRNIFGPGDGTVMYRALDPYRMRAGGNGGGFGSQGLFGAQGGGGMSGLPGFIPFWGSNPYASGNGHQGTKKAGKGALLGSALCASLYGCLMLGILTASVVLVAILLGKIFNNEDRIHRLSRGLDRIAGLNRFRSSFQDEIAGSFDEPLAVVEWSHEKNMPTMVTFSIPASVIEKSEYDSEFPLYVSNGEKIGQARAIWKDGKMKVETGSLDKKFEKQLNQEMKKTAMGSKGLQKIGGVTDLGFLKESMGNDGATCKSTGSESSQTGVAHRVCVSWNADRSEFHVSYLDFE